MDTILRNSRISDGPDGSLVDIGVENGRIAAIGLQWIWVVTHMHREPGVSHGFSYNGTWFGLRSKEGIG